MRAKRVVALEDPAVERGPEEAGGIALVDPAVPHLGRPEGLLGPHARRRVAEAPDAADGLSVEALRERVTLEDPPVPEVQDVEALGLGAAVELLDLADEPRRVRELPEDVREKALVVPRLEDSCGIAQSSAKRRL